MNNRSIIVALVIATLWLAVAITPPYLAIHGIIAGSCYALIALGFALIYRTVRFFHIAHGSIYAISAYSAYTFVTLCSFHSIISYTLAIIVATLTGLLIEIIVYRPLRKVHASNLVLLIASFGVFILVQNLLQLLFGSHTLTLRSSFVKEGTHILGTAVSNTQFLILVSAIVLFVLLWIFVQKTKMGKAIRAASDDPVGARIVGINPERVIFISFGIGSALAGLAGIMISFETGIEPSMGFNAVLKGIIASVIGGAGHITGTLLGGFFLGLVENLGIWKIQAGWKDFIAFVILVVFLLLRPSGIVGVGTKKELL